MTDLELKQRALELSEPERLELAQDLWASVPDPNAHPQAISLPQWQKDLLDERFAKRDEAGSRPWSEVKREIWPRLE